MKNIWKPAALILTACLAMAFLPGCGGQAGGGGETTPEETQTIEETGQAYNGSGVSSLEGVTLDKVAVSCADGDATVSFEVRNDSGTRITYGLSYDLYILKGTEYVLLKPVISDVFLIASSLDAAECRSLSYEISGKYAGIDGGSYKLIFPYFVYHSAEDREQYATAVDFTVE